MPWERTTRPGFEGELVCVPQDRAVSPLVQGDKMFDECARLPAAWQSWGAPGSASRRKHIGVSGEQCGLRVPEETLGMRWEGMRVSRTGKGHPAGSVMWEGGTRASAALEQLPLREEPARKTHRDRGVSGLWSCFLRGYFL